MVRFDLVNLLNQLEIKKKFQLVERVCSGLYANLGFFHQCHTLVAIREPRMRDLQSELRVARMEFRCKERLWEAKKTRLEVELSQGFFPRPRELSEVEYGEGVESEGEGWKGEGEDRKDMIITTSQGVGAPTAASAATGTKGRGGGVGITPEVQSNLGIGVRQVSSVEESQGIVKHGFLWKKSASNLKRDWKRRWFMIQGGKLKYLRQDDVDDKGQSITVCDVMLCTVRERLGPSDSRFVFEVVSPMNSRTYVCKAENEADYGEWVGAIREQTESMLIEGKAAGEGNTGDMGNGGNKIAGNR